MPWILASFDRIPFRTNVLSPFFTDVPALPLDQCFPTRVPRNPRVLQNIVRGSARNQRKNPDVKTTHCFLHREVLVSKTIGEDIKQVLYVAVNMVNFIKQRPLKSRVFAKLSENMQKRPCDSPSTHRGLSCDRNYCFSSTIIIKPVFLTFLKIQNGC
jgi:hypothetical protein